MTINFGKVQGSDYKKFKASAPAYRILIADDCPDNRAAMELRLQHEGVEVAFASNGRECVDLALDARDSASPFDVVVVDVLMPVLDGFSTAMLLRENGCANLIISVTERGMFCDESESLQAGCDFHFSKSELYNRLIPFIRRSVDTGSARLEAQAVPQ